MHRETAHRFEKICCSFIEQSDGGQDSAHDPAHIKRVVANAKLLLVTEKADSQIVVAAAWLHDCVILPKNHPDRKQASTMAAERAVQFLKVNGFPEQKLPGVFHSIEAHSFSAGIPPQTIEAKLVQDADRLDALGAIGIARCLMVGGQLNRPLCNPEDPFCETRKPDDSEWTLDHFYTKLFKLPEQMNTQSAQKEAKKRMAFMQAYLDRLRSEIEYFVT
jgi:uncharacterized protein